MKTTHADVCDHVLDKTKNICEERDYQRYEMYRIYGRVGLRMACPFCFRISHTTLWAFTGSGKRCENKTCGAMFRASGIAYRKKVEKPKGVKTDAIKTKA